MVDGNNGVKGMTQEPYVSAEVVAEYLELERRQVLALTRRGKLPAHAIDRTAKRKFWRFKISEVDAALSGNAPGVALSRVLSPINNAPGSPRSQKG